TLSPNKGVPWFRDGVLIIFDAAGNFVSARVMTTTAAAEVFADGSVVFGNAAVVATSEAAKASAGSANLTWDLVLPHASNVVPHGPLMDILTAVPAGGSFMILPGSQTAAVRNFGISTVWNPAYPGSGAIVDVNAVEPAANVATNGFDATNFTPSYYTNLDIEVKLVSTIVSKSPKLAKPVVVINENIASWAPITGAASYIVLVNNVVLATVTSPSIDLKTIIFDAGLKTIQVRAVTADVKVNSTSVLSNPVSMQFTALSTPSGLSIESDLLSWNEVDFAHSYNIFVNDVLVGNTSQLLFDLAPYRGSAMKNVQVQALADVLDTTHVHSAKSAVILYGNETTTYITLGGQTQHVTFTNSAEWLVKRNSTVAAGGFAGSTEIFLIEDAFAMTSLDNKDVMLTVNGTLVLLSSSGAVKLVRTVLNNHEWLSTNDPLVNNGWTINATYVSGQIKVNQITPYIAEGDYIILSNNTTGKQAGALLSPRDFLAFNFVGPWDTAVASSEIWRSLSITPAFKNPTTTVVKMTEYEVQPYFQLALEKQHITYTNVAEWLVKRNITVPNGGFAASNEIFLIEDAFNLTTLADKTQLLTANGTVILFSQTGAVKAVRTVLNNHEWLATNDPLVNNGWTINTAYTSGQVRVNQLEAHLAEGDYIILTTSGTSKQFGALLNARDFLAYHFLGAWDTTVASSEIWRSTTITPAFVNPSTVVNKIVKLAVDNYVTLGANTQHMTYTTAAEWLVKRNVVVASGGFSGSADIFLIEDAFALTSLENKDVLLTANGTMVLFGANGQVKAVRTVLNNHEWLSTNDPLVNKGWTINTTYATGQVRVNQVTPYIAEGDYIILTTSATVKQPGQTLTARDFLAMSYVGTWDPSVAASEIWRSTTITAAFVNPSLTTIKIHKLPVVF
ncbi:MAG: hypothetical protein U1C51_00220, partial [Candidatus Izemoplasmatales bacterium]|nr:hypothetical protein [Candidatus Izemoplasmatales bacterium]